MKHTNLFKVVVSGFLILLMVACKKQDTEIQSTNQINIGELISNYILGSEKVNDGVISIMARSVVSIKGERIPPDLLIDARFYENKEQKNSFLAGDLKIGNISIPFYNQGLPSLTGYCLQSGVNVDKNTMSLFMSLWGKKNSITLTPSSSTVTKLTSVFPTLVKQNGIDENGFYLPALLEVASPMFEGNKYSIPTDGGSNVYWNPDSNNPSGTIIIGIIQERTTDLNNPVSGEVVFFKEVPDNGVYRLTESDTQVLTPGSVGTIFIGRGSYHTYRDPVTAKEIFLESVAYAAVPFLGISAEK